MKTILEKIFVTVVMCSLIRRYTCNGSNNEGAEKGVLPLEEIIWSVDNARGNYISYPTQVSQMRVEVLFVYLELPQLMKL